MAQANDVALESAASLVATYRSTISLSYTNLQLPAFTNSTIGRVVYVKEAGEPPGPSVMSVQPTGGAVIQASTLLYLSANQCLMLQAFSTNNWGILSAYTGACNVNASFYAAQPDPASAIVNPTMNKTNIFVNLTGQSKTVVLPPIQSLTSISSLCPFYTIKDMNGQANTNNLYISSSGSDLLESSAIQNSIRITQNYASIDLAPEYPNRKWHILNYYDGSLS